MRGSSTQSEVVMPPRSPGSRAAVEAGFRRTLAGSVVGAVLEWYEFAVYGALAATVFAGQFFPASAPHTGILLAFGTQAVGFVARPLGGIFFGHLGDRIGRKPMLVATYMTLALATAGIGLLPTYATWGLAAPIALVILRVIQGFALGGEFGAAVTLVSEYAPPHQRGRWAALPQAGGPAGTIIAAGVLTLLGASLSKASFDAWGWRADLRRRHRDRPGDPRHRPEPRVTGSHLNSSRSYARP